MTTNIAIKTQHSAVRPGADSVFQRIASLRTIVGGVFGRWLRSDRAGGVLAPTCSPFNRDAGKVEVASAYLRGTDVWAYVAGSWLPARVVDVDGNSGLVTYRVPGSRMWLVESVHASHLVRRCSGESRSSVPSARGTSAHLAGEL
ncbi:hypothetical protein [Catellatospora chokoriensis]|uniref:Uncharacterized protein n=1 Tax=Catellatospora chokoriensis TaxID=310353 RepID=A0A8J3NX46_9ACTN|nr:hypothetical protein [Catellatospora chokoriensis]GIF93935.1 hypothetical protein Cch02nite_73790 [Catellatospora chokoriensis]